MATAVSLKFFIRVKDNAIGYFLLQKNRTYAFCLGSVEGVEIKIRYL